MYQKEDMDVLADIKHFLSNVDLFQSKAVPACILFSDLVGSTEFKRYHSIEEGLAKTFLHNSVATKCIEDGGGEVVKYIGDEVMGIFKGQNCEQNAMKAALAIIKGLNVANKQQGWTDFPYSMSTKIGLKSGNVWMFKYDNNQGDPQGTTVDIAARFTSLARPNQIICDEETYTKACQNCAFPEPCAKIQRYLKGIKNRFNLYVIVPKGYPCEILDYDTKPTPFQKKLNEARQLVYEKKCDKAFELFEQIYKDNPGNFHVNIHMAEHLLWKGDVEINNGNQGIEMWKAAEEHLGQAVCARPSYCQGWLLFSRLYFKYYEITDELDKLDKAIDYARKALQYAHDRVNVGSILQANVYLINSLSAYAKQTGDGEKLSEAVKLCTELHPDVENILKECRSEFYVAYAKVQNLCGDENFHEMEKLLQTARALNPENIHIYRVEEEIHKRRYPNSGFGGMRNLSGFSYAT